MIRSKSPFTLDLPLGRIAPPPVRRWLIYKTRESRQFYCVVAARTAGDAVKIAKRQTLVGPKAIALPEQTTSFHFR